MAVRSTARETEKQFGVEFLSGLDLSFLSSRLVLSIYTGNLGTCIPKRKSPRQEFRQTVHPTSRQILCRYQFFPSVVPPKLQFGQLPVCNVSNSMM